LFNSSSVISAKQDLSITANKITNETDSVATHQLYRKWGKKWVDSWEECGYIVALNNLLINIIAIVAIAIILLGVIMVGGVVEGFGVNGDVVIISALKDINIHLSDELFNSSSVISAKQDLSVTANKITNETDSVRLIRF
jgi:adhesin HecA-like repeat protein